MITSNIVLPLEIQASKSFYKKKFIGHILLLVLFSVAFWFGSGRFFMDDYYYPQLVIIMPIGIIAIICLMIRDAISAVRNKPIIFMNEQGIQLFERNFDKLGMIHWEDITSYREIATTQYKRKMLFFVANPITYITRIPGTKKQRKFMKQSASHNDALFWIESNQIDYNINAFKNIISEKINHNS